MANSIDKNTLWATLESHCKNNNSVNTQKTEGQKPAEDSSAKKQNENDSKENKSIFQEFDHWQNMHALNMKHYSYGEFNEDCYDYIANEKLGETFDFTEGRDVSDDKIYNEQLSKLAKGEIALKDKNDDGKINFNEYITQELIASGALAGLKDDIAQGLYTEDEATELLADTYTKTMVLFDIIDMKMGDSDSEIDEKEFQTYYGYLDTYSGATDTDRGSISVDDIVNYPEYLTSQVDLDKYHTKEIDEQMRKLLAE